MKNLKDNDSVYTCPKCSGYKKLDNGEECPTCDGSGVIFKAERKVGDEFKKVS